jgi:cold-inducible RNA-binding protein
MNMYVSNLSFNISENDLQALFSEFGTVNSLKIITDRETGRSRGFGFVEMDIEEEANNAIKALNNKDFQGRPLSVSEAREKPQRSNRGY